MNLISTKENPYIFLANGKDKPHIHNSKKNTTSPSSSSFCNFKRLLCATTACLNSVMASALFCLGNAASAACRRALAAENPRLERVLLLSIQQTDPNTFEENKIQGK